MIGKDKKKELSLWIGKQVEWSTDRLNNENIDMVREINDCEIDELIER